MNDRLLVALDTPDVAHAYQLMAQVAPHCGGFKVGKTLFYACAAAGSSHAPAATPAWTALIDRAAATLAPPGSPDQPSCRRPAARRDRGPR